MRTALEYASSIWSTLVSWTRINKLQGLRTTTGCTQDTNIQYMHNERLILSIYEHPQLHVSQYLIYCVEVWGNALSKHVQPLIKLQNKILKIITPSHRFINKEQLYAHSGILPFNLLVKH